MKNSSPSHQRSPSKSSNSLYRPVPLKSNKDLALQIFLKKRMSKVNGDDLNKIDQRSASLESRESDASGYKTDIYKHMDKMIR